MIKYSEVSYVTKFDALSTRQHIRYAANLF